VRNVLFGLLVTAVLAIFSTPLTTLLQFSFRQEHYSHIVLIPLVSAALVILDRRQIFSHLQKNWLPGFATLTAGLLLAAFGHRPPGAMSVNDQLSVTMFGVVLAIIGGFVLCYGLRAVRAALFPLSFLFLAAPIPDAFLRLAIAWLRAGSAEVSYVLFELAGVPALRSGFTFSLPGVTVEVAEECSGIRSSLALLITSLLIGHLMLRSVWAKGALVLATLPLLVIKNGIRIVTLSVLAVYVDPRFLSGNLHQRGGIVFFVISLAFLALFLRWLQKSEQRSGPFLSKDAGLTDVAS
jgi:exosortase